MPLQGQRTLRFRSCHHHHCHQRRGKPWSMEIYAFTRAANSSIPILPSPSLSPAARKALVNGNLCLYKGSELFDSDLAITITVTSGEESLGLLVSECSGGSREVLQEELQLLLLNEAAVVLVNDFEGVLDIICRLAGQSACLEKLLVVKGVSTCAAIQS